MKSILTALVAAFAFATASAADAPVSQIMVMGTATTQVQPDLLKWQLSISNSGQEITAVAEHHARVTEAALAFLKSQGIAQNLVQTSGMRFAERNVYRSGAQVRDGYTATTEVAFTSKELASYSALWTGLSKLEGISVRTVTWDTSKRIELQNSTRLDALKAARTKAVEMAAAYGSRIGEPLVIREIPMDTNGGFTSRGFTVAPAGSNINSSYAGPSVGNEPDVAAVAPGAITVQIRVEVTFRLSQN